MSLKGFFTAALLDDGSPVTGHYYEMAASDGRAQVWAYSDALSYSPGETLHLHATSTAAKARLTIARDGEVPQIVLESQIDTTNAPTPADASSHGCNWPEVFALVLPENWPSGVYTLTLTIPGHQSQHLFVLKSTQPKAKILMLLATGTWCAYNDWGGSNHYQGLTGPNADDFAAQVSLHRPWATGFVAWPPDAPRIPHASPLLTKPRYPHMDYARAKGVSKKYASSGWAAFERPFANWCAAQGIALDFTTQHDLHQNPGALDGYDRVLIVGHDEYWTWEMRDHLDGWIAAANSRGSRAISSGRPGFPPILPPKLAINPALRPRIRSATPTASPPIGITHRPTAPPPQCLA